MALKSFNEVALANGLQQLLQLAAEPVTVSRCVAAAQKLFLLTKGIRRYATVYRQLGGTA